MSTRLAGHRRSRAPRRRLRGWPFTRRAEKGRLASWQAALSLHGSVSRKGVGIALVVSVVLTLSAFALLQIWLESVAASRPSASDVKASPSLSVELVEPEQPPKPPPEFVEANPDAPIEKPEETNQESFVDQVAANPDPQEALPLKDSPAVEGDLPDSQKIVEGEAQPTDFVPPAPRMADIQNPPQAEAPREQRNDAGKAAPAGVTFARNERVVAMPAMTAPASEVAPLGIPDGDLEDGFPVPPADVQPVEPAGAERAPEQVRVAPLPRVATTDNRIIEIQVEAVEGVETAPGESAPRPRPRINFKVPPGLTRDDPVATSRIGSLAIDANFSEFGAYQQRMLEAISAQWNLLGSSTTLTSGDIAAFVATAFELNQKGQVENFEILKSTASRPATLLVKDAVLSRAPFGLWTEDMTSELGEKQSIRITFHYR